MNTKANAKLIDGSTVRGILTTDHATSSYGQPVFIDNNGTVYDWILIASIDTPALLGKRGGSKTSDTKAAASRANGRKGGRPRKS